MKFYLHHGRLVKCIKWRTCDVGELILQPFRHTSPTSQVILQPSRLFTYVTAHSPTLLSLLLLILCSFSNLSVTLHLRHSSFSNPSVALRHSSFSNPSVALPSSQFIVQPFRCFTYVTAHSPTLLSLLLLILCSFSNLSVTLHLCHSSFFNPTFASPTLQARHLASRPWNTNVSRNCGDSVNPLSLCWANDITCSAISMIWRS